MLVLVMEAHGRVDQTALPQVTALCVSDRELCAELEVDMSYTLQRLGQLLATVFKHDDYSKRGDKMGSREICSENEKKQKGKEKK